MTVPRGYAEGTLTPYEAVVYLEKLGIDESLYLDVAKAVLRIPSGYRVTTPSGETKVAGQFIRSADDEPDWPSFEQGAPVRDPRWKIEYDDSLVYDEVMEEGESGINFDEFTGRLIESMGLNYTIADVREVAKYYAKQLIEAREAAQGDEEQLKKISEAEDSLVDDLNVLAENAKKRQQAEKEAVGGELEPTKAENIKELIKELGGFTAYIAKGKGYVPGRASFPITLRDVKGSKVAEGRRDLNLATVLTALAVANTEESLKTLDKLVKAARAHKSGDAQAPVVTIRAGDIFTSLTPEKGYLVLLETANPGALGDSDEDKIRAGIKLAQYMSEETADTLAEKRDKLGETEMLWSIEAKLNSVLQGDSSEAYKEVVMNLTEIQKAKEFLSTVFNGGAAFQVVVDLAMYGFETPQYALIESIFSSMDAYLVLGDGSVTLSGMLKSIIREPDGADLGDKLNILKKEINRHVAENPVNVKAGVTAGQLTKLHNAISASLTLNAEDLVYNTILTLSSPGDKSVRQVIGDFLRDGRSTGEFTQHKGPELAKNLVNLVRKMKGQGKGDSQTLADPKMLGAIESEVRKLGYDDILVKEIAKTIQRRAANNSTMMESAFGSSSSFLEVRDASQRGAVALLIAGLQKHIRGESEKFDMAGSMARLVTRVLSGNFEGYAPEIGSFFAGTQAVFAEILNRARVLPRLDDNDNISWGGNGAFRDSLLNDYLKKHPEATGQIIDDITLIKHASHTKTEFPSHYLIVANIHTNAEFLVGDSGERMFTSERELGNFTSNIESVNLSNPENAAEVNRVADRIDRTNKLSVDIIGTKVAGKRFASELQSDSFNPSDYTEISLSSAADYFAKSRKNMTPREAEVTLENLKSLVSSRLSEYTKNQSVVDYITKQIGSGAGNGGTTGHAFEIISGIPSLINHIQETGMVDATVMSDGVVDGIFWKGSDGKSHSFGKIANAHQGTVDFMKVTYGEGEIEVHPVEGKMEREGGAVPHHGNPQEFSEAVAKLWNNSGRGKVRIFPPMVTNAPHGSPGETGSGIHSLSMDFGARTILTVGRSFNKGRIHNGTSVRRMMV